MTNIKINADIRIVGKTFKVCDGNLDFYRNDKDVDTDIPLKKRVSSFRRLYKSLATPIRDDKCAPYHIMRMLAEEGYFNVRKATKPAPKGVRSRMAKC